jgi:hypothetical protein
MEFIALLVPIKELPIIKRNNVHDFSANWARPTYTYMYDFVPTFVQSLANAIKPGSKCTSRKPVIPHRIDSSAMGQAKHENLHQSIISKIETMSRIILAKP